MTLHGSSGKRGRSAVRLVGLFGGLGTGNIGNDASLEAMLSYLMTEHPDTILDAMCGGPEVIRDRYGITAIPSQWYMRHEQQASGGTA